MVRDAVARVARAYGGFIERAHGRLLDQALAELSRQRDMSDEQLAAIRDAERDRETQFWDMSVKRLGRDIARAFRITDPAERRRQLLATLDRERRYMRQRQQAVLQRGDAQVEFDAVRAASPEGALWVLDPKVKEHTPECVALAGKFWPWSVLEKMKPPLHPGCPCRLMSWRDAWDRGLLGGDAVPKSRKIALQRARRLKQRFPKELSEAETVGLERLALLADGPRELKEGAYEWPAPPRNASGRLRVALSNLPNGATLLVEGHPIRRAGNGYVVDGVLCDLDEGVFRGRRLSGPQLAEKARHQLRGRRGQFVDEGLPGAKLSLADFGGLIDGFSYGGITSRVEHSERWRPAGGQVRAAFYTDAGEKAGDGWFNFQGDRAEVQNIELRSEFRNAGFGTALIANLFDGLREAGMSKVDVETIADGGYFWARMGFRFRGASALAQQRKIVNEAKLQGRWQEIIDNIGPVEAQRFEEWLNVSRSEAEIAMYGLNDRWKRKNELGKEEEVWPGKAVMVWSRWTGELELEPAEIGVRPVTATAEPVTDLGDASPPPSGKQQRRNRAVRALEARGVPVDEKGPRSRWRATEEAEVLEPLAEAIDRYPVLRNPRDGGKAVDQVLRTSATSGHGRMIGKLGLMTASNPLGVAQTPTWDTTKVIVNDKDPPMQRKIGSIEVIVSEATQAGGIAGASWHEIGHLLAYANGVGTSDDQDEAVAESKRLLERFDIGFEDVEGVSVYAASDPREAIAELGANWLQPEWRAKMDPGLREKADAMFGWLTRE